MTSEFNHPQVIEYISSRNNHNSQFTYPWSSFEVLEDNMIFCPRQVFLFCLLAITSKSDGKTQNSSPKPVDKLNPQAGQNFVVNNNCGLAKTEREMMAHIKAKVDYIAAQSSKGNELLYYLFSIFSSTTVVVDGWKFYSTFCRFLTRLVKCSHFSIAMSYRMGSLWKVLLPRHRCANARVGWRTKKLPEAGRRLG